MGRCPAGQSRSRILMEEKMARVLLVAVLFTIGATAQQLTVVPSTIQGVELVGPESPNFEALVTQIVGTDRPIGFAAALPYALVIRNSTSEAIAAIDTVWTTTDRILLNATDAMFNKAILYVKPGQAVVASPLGILQNQRQMQIFANGTTESHRLENFRNPGNVTVAIDAVVFESGQFVGADRYGAFEQWEAQIQAPRDLASTVLQKQGSQSIREIVTEEPSGEVSLAPPTGTRTYDFLVDGGETSEKPSLLAHKQKGPPRPKPGGRVGATRRYRLIR